MIRFVWAIVLLCAALPARAEVAIQEVTSPGGITAWLVEDFLDIRDSFAADTCLVTSASSKTAIALAYSLRQRGKFGRARIAPGAQDHEHQCRNQGQYREPHDDFERGCVVYFYGHSFPDLLFRSRLQKHVAFDEIEQVEHGPGLVAPLVRPAEEAVAANDGLRCLAREFMVTEATEPEHLVHDETGRHFAVVDGYDARRAPQGRPAAPQKQFDVDQRQQVAAQIGDSQQPAARARHTSHRIREHQDLADLVAIRDELLVTDAKPDADPLGRNVAGPLAGMRRAAAPLHFPEQLERMFDECREIRRRHLRRPSPS